MSHVSKPGLAQDQEQLQEQLQEQKPIELSSVERTAKDGDFQPLKIVPPLVDGGEVVGFEGANIELGRQTTRATTIRPLPVRVLRSQRRGLCGRFTILAEVEEPRDYPDGTKWFITGVIAMAAGTAPLGSTIILRA